MFNLAREICRTKGIPFLSVHRDSCADMPWSETELSLINARSQSPMDDLLNFIVNFESPAVITVRDPRGALVSLM